MLPQRKTCLKQGTKLLIGSNHTFPDTVLGQILMTQVKTVSTWTCMHQGWVNKHCRIFNFCKAKFQSNIFPSVFLVLQVQSLELICSHRTCSPWVYASGCHIISPGPRQSSDGVGAWGQSPLWVWGGIWWSHPGPAGQCGGHHTQLQARGARWVWPIANNGQICLCSKSISIK